MTAIFVTATGTEIGKTFVTAGLIRHLRQRGHAVEALKPVVTGFDSAAAAASDPGVLLAALGEPVTMEAVAAISPWRYRAPLAPDMAAQREGATLAFSQLVDFTRRAVAHRRDVLLIEGIGGVMVPLDDRHTVLDWMTLLNIPLILVTGGYLGTISHTLTAFEAVKRCGLTVRSIVVNESEGSTVPLADTVATIARFVRPARVVPLARAVSGAPDPAAFAQMFGD